MKIKSEFRIKVLNVIQKLILTIFFSLNFLLQQSAFGQVQINIPNYIRQKFENYCKSVPREEIFIHTDREEYISGEELWFNIYLIDRQSFKPSPDSKIVYFEILNPENKPVLQKRILIENGFGPGQVVLPDSLGSGTYTIRAYTNWMKNFLPYNCFLKDLNVYDPLNTKTFTRSSRLSALKGTSSAIQPAGSGLCLKVNNLREDTLEILISTDEKFRSETNNLLYLLIQTHGIIDHISTENTTEKITRITIPKDSLTPGINQITIFDTKGPVAERYIYTPVNVRQILNFHSTDSCKQRDKVKLELEIMDGSSGRSGLTNLSVSVASVADSSEISDLTEYLVFGTEFGSFPGNVFRGQRITRLSPEIMDSLLLTMKSNWIDWETIFSDEVQSFKNPVEKEEHYISGRLLTNNLQPAYGGEILLMSTPGKEALFQYTKTDSDGDFNFRINIDDEFKDLIIQPDIGSVYQKVYVGKSFSDLYPENKIFVDSTNEQIPSSILQQCINYQVRKVYGSSSAGDRITPFIPPSKQSRFYGKPDFVLVMKDFILLDSMQEVFFELVPRVELESVNSVFEMAVFDPLKNKLEGSPVVMIDGVIIKDLSLIANLDPDLVEKIDVIWDRYRVGSYLFNGIVNLITKTGDFSCVPLPSDAVRLHYRVIDTACSFISPDYSLTGIKNSKIADYRNTLYWNPSVHPDENGKASIEFWTADNKADYLISINGITSEGKTVSFRKSFKVR